MSKRKNRNPSPNIPQSTLDRAREEANAAAPVDTNEPDETVEVIDDTPVVQFREPPRVAVERRPRPTRSTGVRPASNKSSRKEEKHDINYIRSRLANPTRIVTEAQLKAEYSYVINDLRSMGILAAVLIAALVVIERLV
ncbi:MAG: hypothetical protein LCI00_11235 [Chloroflexi bacterium]|nr:hypothetical protein [Chloroflexota bacterium]